MEERSRRFYRLPKQTASGIRKVARWGISGIAAVALAELLLESTSAHIRHGDPPAGHTGRFTYGSSSCTPGSEVDPINVVFYGYSGSGGQPWGVATVAAAAGEVAGFWWGGGSTQYFWDHSQCEPMDDQKATGGRMETRYHMRYNQGDDGGNPDWDMSVGYYATSDAHHEDWILGCGGWLPGNHAVDSNLDEPPGGFVMARDYVVGHFADAGYGYFYEYDWDNGDRWFTQCDGWPAWTDGIVAFIQVPHGGGLGGLPFLGGDICNRGLCA